MLLMQGLLQNGRTLSTLSELLVLAVANLLPFDLGLLSRLHIVELGVRYIESISL